MINIFKSDNRRRHTFMIRIFLINIFFSAFKHGQTNFFAIRINRHVRRRKRCDLMSDMNHRSIVSNQITLFGRTLCHKHIIRSFRLAESIHNSSIERIGMIATLMVKRVPEASADYLLRLVAYRLIT